jgi:hypothetical protein
MYWISASMLGERITCGKRGNGINAENRTITKRRRERRAEKNGRELTQRPRRAERTPSRKKEAFA